MKKKFHIAKRRNYAEGIRYGKQWVLHLVEGTALNEHFVKWVVGRLNGLDVEPPPLPEDWRPKK